MRCVADISLADYCRASRILFSSKKYHYSTASSPASEHTHDTSLQFEQPGGAGLTTPARLSTIPLAGYVDLSQRRALIEVSGKDAFRFLHGLLTNEPPIGTDGIYASFLNVRVCHLLAVVFRIKLG